MKLFNFVIVRSLVSCLWIIRVLDFLIPFFYTHLKVTYQSMTKSSNLYLTYYSQSVKILSFTKPALRKKKNILSSTFVLYKIVIGDKISF